MSPTPPSTALHAILPIVSRQLGSEQLLTVLGRDLHEWLGVKKDYSDWIKAQVKRAKLFEHMDFEIFPLFPSEGVKSPRGRPASEYGLSLDAAKRIAMLCSTEKGHEVRTYFLACERELEGRHRTLPTLHDPAYQMLLQAVIDLDTTRHELTIIATEQQRQAQELIATQSRTIEALTKADLALEGAHTMTVEEFVVKNGLVHQFPPASYARLATWLGHFCQQWGLDVHKAPAYGKSWDYENAYPLQAFGALLRAETRQARQLRLVTEEKPHEQP